MNIRSGAGQGVRPGGDQGGRPGGDRDTRSGSDPSARSNRGEMAELSDLVVDTRNGRARYVIIDTNGIQGSDNRGGAQGSDNRMGAQGSENHKVAVPFDALSWDTSSESFTLRVTSEQLDRLPKFDPNNLKQLNDPASRSNVHGIFGTRPGSDEAEQEKADDYTRLFADGRTETHKGTITSVNHAGDRSDAGRRSGGQSDAGRRAGGESDAGRHSSDQCEGGKLTAIKIRIGRESEEQTVLLAPASFLREQSTDLNSGDEVTVTTRRGLSSEDGKSVHIAQSIQSNGRTIQLRDRNGNPAWENRGENSRLFLMLASELNDSTLHSRGDEFGSLENVIVEVQSGTIAFLVVSADGASGTRGMPGSPGTRGTPGTTGGRDSDTGGIDAGGMRDTRGMADARRTRGMRSSGIGEIPVPFSAITYGRNGDLHVDMPAERMRNAPKFTRDAEEELKSEAFVKRVCDFFGVSSDKFDTERASRWQGDSSNRQQQQLGSSRDSQQRPSRR